MTVYVSEEFTPAEADVLRRYFTNLDGPVFALVNLPEVVKGALFARYSRSPKSLRRLFLDEFVGDLDIAGDASVDATVGLQRAEELYDRVFFEYGDDSVAQLGGVHLACEQASNLLTKVLEWGRLMSYLEQCTRYIAYDARLGGRYRYYRDPEVLGSPMGLRYVGDLDRMFDTYAEMADTMLDYYRERFPKQPGDSDFVHRQALKAKALDAVRGLLPAASLSNVGIYGTGQAYEALLLRMRAHPLPEARSYADLMLTELRKVIPSFLKRVDLTDRGVAASAYLATTRASMEDIADQLFPEAPPRRRGAERRAGRVRPRRRGPARHRHALPVHRPARVGDRRAKVRRLPVRRPGGDHPGVRRRAHQSAPPARAGVRAADVPVRRAGRLRRLPRPPAPPHAHRRVAAAVARATATPGPRRSTTPAAATAFDESMERLAERCTTPWPARFPAQAPYAVALAYRLRFVDADERPRGDAPHRAAQRPAGPRGLPRGGAGDAPAHRREGGPPRRRGGHASSPTTRPSRSSSGWRASAGPSCAASPADRRASRRVRRVGGVVCVTPRCRADVATLTRRNTG